MMNYYVLGDQSITRPVGDQNSKRPLSAASPDQERDLLTGAVDTFNQDAFDVGGF